MEPKDYVLAAGVLVTLTLGIWNAVENHRTSRRATFVNTVTSQRILCLEQLRQDIGTFCGLTLTWSLGISDDDFGADSFKEIDRLRHIIRLRLNPEGSEDTKIERLLSSITELTAPKDLLPLKQALEELTQCTQRLLKEEWEKVKQESSNGPTSKRP